MVDRYSLQARITLSLHLLRSVRLYDDSSSRCYSYPDNTRLQVAVAKLFLPETSRMSGNLQIVVASVT